MFTDSLLLDIDHYVFYTESQNRNTTNPVPVAKDTSEVEELEPPPKIKIPKQENYRLAFTATDITTAVTFDFASQLYQPSMEVRIINRVRVS